MNPDDVIAEEVALTSRNAHGQMAAGEEMVMIISEAVVKQVLTNQENQKVMQTKFMSTACLVMLMNAM